MNLSGAEVADWWKGVAGDESSGPRRTRRYRHAGVALLVATTVVGTVVEFRSSWLQSRLLPAFNRRLGFAMASGAAENLPLPAAGPYDQRLGYTSLPGFVDRLEQREFAVTAQARVSNAARGLTLIGLPPIYHEKSQAGLRIEDWQGNALLNTRYPAQVYADFHAIPPLVADTLLYIENRQLRQGEYPGRNPAIEWERVGKAVLDLAVHAVDGSHPVSGGSTLATQLEKLRHSPGGRTASVGEKVRQVATASLRAYQDGSDTGVAQQRIVCDYINSIPLAATRSRGEIFGLADGLRAWYGADFDTVNGLLAANEKSLDGRQMQERARAYRQVLSLFLALRAPTWYLGHHRDALVQKTDQYLRVLAGQGIISPRLRDLALRERDEAKPVSEPAEDAGFVSNKATNSIRFDLLPMLGLDNTYALDRLDLTVRTAFDKGAQDAVTEFLAGLSDPSQVRAAGLNQHQLLDRGEPGGVIYSVTLYERSGGANMLRVQTDNFDQPLDINQGTKLQLGSTAKLRTLVHYLEIVAELHAKYASVPSEKLHAVPAFPGDTLTDWALTYLTAARDRSLEAMLEAALQRKYSGSPGESFFTAGGLHQFVNFERAEDYQLYTVGDAFQHSVNLVFIRLLRDIERYHVYRVPGTSPYVLSDPNDRTRARYLERFADMEGRTFLTKFYDKYDGQNADAALETLVRGIRLTPLRAAVIFRSVRTGDGVPAFDEFLRRHLPASALAGETAEDLYKKYGPEQFNLQDRGYLAGVHPLELWLLQYQRQHPKATLAEMVKRSAGERQEVYAWLFKTRHKHAQDVRIQTLLEIDAFKEIHKAWQRLGYPFDSLVPSYATSIGVSGDKPAALAELTGILLNDGMRYPVASIEKLHFGAGTPAETILERRNKPGERVLDPLIARLVRREMIGVIENGTGRRLRGGLTLPDGTVVPVGGKTGTGDNRFEVYGAHGGLVGSRAVSRTAAFTFFMGDRFYGTILAFVRGKDAANYEFTSALAVQVLEKLKPAFLPLLERKPGA